MQRRRMMRAVGIIAASLLVLGLWTPAEYALSGRSAEARAFSGMEVAGGTALSVLEGRDGDALEAGGALGGIDRTFGRVPADVPPWFREEVLPLADVEELRANDEWSVVGFASDRSCEEELAWAQEHLRERGWSLVQSGMEGAVSAVKEGGRASWLLFSCRSVGGKTCVVVQVAAA